MKRKSYKSKIKMFFINILFLTILSLSILILPYADKSDNTDLYRILNGIMFWVGFVGTFTVAFIINHYRRNDQMFNKAAEKYKKLALTHFFQNRPAMAFDIFLILSVVGFIISITFKMSHSVSFVFLSAIVFSFGMHCMLNGINFVYVMTKRIRRVKKHEQC